jgi:hypothetical protein
MRSYFYPVVSLLILLLTGLADFQPLFAQKQGLPMVRRPIIQSRRFYDRKKPAFQNSVKLQLLQIPNTMKLTYERILHQRISIGINGAYQYAAQEEGSSKIDGFVKIFLGQAAPSGFYFYTSHGRANISDHTFKYRMTDTENGKEITFKADRPYVVEEKGTFKTYMGTVGFGVQSIVGQNQNMVIDFGVGYQFYSIPDQFKKSIIANDLVYDKFEANNRIMGPTSPNAARFGFGFMF